ncbi:MAG: hypothetical protein AB1599_02385 [Planctomycetota bacterium]
MKIDNVPELTINAITNKKGETIFDIRVNKWKWIAEDYWAFILLDDYSFIEGQFKDVNQKKLTAKFITKIKIDNKIQCNKFYPYLAGYWQERAEIVLDKSLRWSPVNFEPRDAIKHKNDGSTETIKNGWDHEHCNICWATISLHENTSYMKSNKNHDICLECFEKYIKQRSIEFGYQY